jgi:hypothetical protein
LHAVLHGNRRVAVAPGEFLTRGACNLETHQEVSFFLGEPSHLPAVIQEVVEKDLGIERLLPGQLLDLNVRDRISDHVPGCSAAGFANAPAECLPAQCSGNREGEVSAADFKLGRVQELKKDEHDVLSGIVMPERRERGREMARRAMDGRNKDQQQKPLAQGPERAARMLLQQLSQQGIGG